MNNIKKAGIITGAVIGGAIGGTLSVIGKVSKNKFIDELGESVVDSTILTGKIAGEIASGATHMVSGTLTQKPKEFEEGKNDLKSAGTKVLKNVVSNIQTVVDNGGEIIDGVKEKDKKKVVRSTKNLVKVVAVGAMTVGAIKIKPESEEEVPNNIGEHSKNNNTEENDINTKTGSV